MARVVLHESRSTRLDESFRARRKRDTVARVLRDVPDENEGQGAVSTVDERGRPRVLACARCSRVITSVADRTEMNGAHEHTFDNPDGERFRIGCFAHASGLLRIGPSSREWTWFTGYSWQSEVCAGCRGFLGWLYRRDDHLFHGLVLDGLVEVDEN